MPVIARISPAFLWLITRSSYRVQWPFNNDLLEGDERIAALLEIHVSGHC